MLRIRLRRMGAKKKPTYRLVVADARTPRDGAFLDIVGHYNPRTDPATVVVDAAKAQRWLAHGAQPSDRVARLFKREGITAGAAAAATAVAAPAAAPAEPEPSVAAPAAAPAEPEPVAAAPAAAAPEAEPVAATPAAPEAEPAAAAPAEAAPPPARRRRTTRASSAASEPQPSEPASS